MDEYIYAGKGWEPEVGDACEADTENGGWVECLIVEPAGLHPGYDYVVHSPNNPSPHFTGEWSVAKCFLRKRINPDDTLADEDFITDLKSLLNREGVKA